MKKELLVLLIGFLLTVVSFSGCQEQETNEQLISASLITFALTKNDVPEVFNKSGNSTQFILDGDVTDDPIEHYRAWFINPGYIDPIDNSNYTTDQMIYYELNKYVDIDMAKSCFYPLPNLGDDRVVNESINSMGDYSIAYLSYQDNLSYCSFYFRIHNVLVEFVNMNVSYQQTYDLAKIVEQRIYNSIS